MKNTNFKAMLVLSMVFVFQIGCFLVCNSDTFVKAELSERKHNDMYVIETSKK